MCYGNFVKISVQQNGTLKCAYTYLADGTKVMAQDNASSSASNGYLYLGSMVFKKTGTSYAFESTDFGGGRIINVNGTLSPYYYATDHLGSVRAITDASGNVTERNDYYVFGKRMTTGESYPVMTSNRWKYNGKEVQTTGNVNWLDYGAREYDEVTGRWTRQDPMSEKYYGTSGYAYCVDNPIIFLDSDGQEKLIFLNPHQTKNKQIINAAKKAVDNNAINIYAHGGLTEIFAYNGKQAEKVNNSYDFVKKILSKSDIWRRKKEGEKITIVLHACQTGKGENPFAQNLSRDLKDVFIIAPDQKDYFISEKELGPQDRNREHNVDGDNQNKSEDKEYDFQKEFKSGNWITFQNGKPVASHPGTWVPTNEKGFWEKLWNRLFR